MSGGYLAEFWAGFAMGAVISTWVLLTVHIVRCAVTRGRADG